MNIPEGLQEQIDKGNTTLEEATAYLQKIENNNLINDYKSKLKDTDYIVSKLTEALAINDSNEVAAIESEYAEQLTNRKNWRSLINELEKEINQLDNSDDSSD